MDLIHCHLPFCAGQSLRRSMNRFGRRRVNNTEDLNIEIEKCNNYIYQNSRILKSNLKLTDEQKKQRINVVFVRNPYDRFVSNWNKLKDILNKEGNNIQSDNIKRITEKGMIISFQKRIESNTLPLDKLVSKYLEKYNDLNDFLQNGGEDIELLNSLKISNNFRSMSYFCEGEWDRFDRIIKCEDGVEEAIRSINNEFNLFDIDDNFKVPYINSFPKIFKNEQLDQKSKDIIYELHYPDFKYLQYNK